MCIASIAVLCYCFYFNFYSSRINSKGELTFSRLQKYGFSLKAFGIPTYMLFREVSKGYNYAKNPGFSERVPTLVRGCHKLTQSGNPMHRFIPIVVRSHVTPTHCKLTVFCAGSGASPRLLNSVALPLQPPNNDGFLLARKQATSSHSGPKCTESQIREMRLFYPDFIQAWLE